MAAIALAVLLAGCDSIEERTEKHYQRGVELIGEGAPEKALLEFRNALSMNDRHVPTLFAMGRLQEDLGDMGAAFAAYTSVADIDPNHLEAQVKVARFHLLAGNAAAATEAVEAAMRMDPVRAEIHALQAGVAFRTGDLEAARAGIDQALTLDPDQIDARTLEIGYLFQSGEPDAALTKADVLLADHPDELTVHLIKLQILQTRKDTAAIGEQLKIMTAAFPGELRFREALALWATRNGDNDTARTELRALVEALPDNQDAVVNLIQFARRADGDAAARDELTRLIDAAENPFALELLLVQFDMETGAEEQAINALRGMGERPGDDAVRARVELARLLTRRNRDGDRAEAERLTDGVLEREPGNTVALAMRAARLLSDDAIEPAFADIRRGLEEAPDNLTLLALAGRANEMSGAVGLANDRFARAVRVSNYDARTVERYIEFLLRNERITAAEIILTEAAQRNPRNVRILNLLGFTRVRLENWAGANEAVSALTRLDPVAARQLRASILIEQERFDEGAQMLRGLAEDEGTRERSVAALVQTFVRAGKPEEAIAFLDRLITENPENLQALGIRSNFHVVAGELDEAEALLREILRLQPDHGGAYSALARIATIRGDAETSERMLMDGLGVSPGNLLLLARLAQLQEGRGDFDQAIETYEQLYELTPDSLLVANNLASLLSDHRVDNPAAVDRAYALASRLAGIDRPQYRDTFGWTRHLKGEHEAALAAVEPLLEALPGNPWVHYHLGMIYNALGRNAEARQQLEAALTKGDTMPWAETVTAALDGLATE